MRILHVSFENFQDVPGLLSRSHAYLGDEGALVTMVPSRLGFMNGTCLYYPFLNSGPTGGLAKIMGRHNVNVLETELRLKVKGEKSIEKLYYKARDFAWLYMLGRAWRRHGFDSYDVYHFDGDVPFIYGDRILKKLKGKKIVTHFFGSELRKWGMNPHLREHAQIRFTSELDHTKIDPSLVFVPIPFEGASIRPRVRENEVLRVGHSPTRRTAKGTADIIEAVNRVRRHLNFEFLLIEGVSHSRCMELKATCDIGIDQIGNYAGTGYGRSGLEFLALGIPTITEIPEEYDRLLPKQPFVNATKDNFEEVLSELLSNADLRGKKRKEGIEWVRNFPDPKRIITEVYKEYRRIGWIH
ncbi:MAG: hypothetical protein JSW49_10890 [candidate division WOR-3 bacterium]|nr:MAG: hypothetical protein JSW49_10890 [candidate division WOR-3 bacterium]